MRPLPALGCFFLAVTVSAQVPADGPIAPFVSVNAPVFVLDHVRVMDGTGAAAREDQAIVVANGKIQFAGPAASAPIPEGARRMELSGYTVIPGIVGMHDHLYYSDSIAVQVIKGYGEPGLFVAAIPYTGPRLYLAAGVTTMRTTGSLEPYADLKVKSRIDANLMPGPDMDATAPYLEGAPTIFAQMHELTGPDDAILFRRRIPGAAGQDRKADRDRKDFRHPGRREGGRDAPGREAPRRALRDWRCGSCGPPCTRRNRA